MNCICPRCGRRLESKELCFDLSEIMKRSVYQALASREVQEEREDWEDPRNWERIANGWTNAGIGVGLVSEAELLGWTRDKKTVTQEKNNLTREGVLNIPNEEWQRRIGRYLTRRMMTLWPQEEDRWKSGIAAFLEEHRKQFQTAKSIHGDGNAPETETVEDLIILDKLAHAERLPGGFRERVLLTRYDTGDIEISEVRRASDRVLIGNVRHCPHCGGEMSYWAGRNRELVLTVVGGPRASKSTALAACAAFFMDNNNGVRYAIRWEPYEDDADWKGFYEACVVPYRKGAKVTPTDVTSKKAVPRFSVRLHLGKSAYPVTLTVVDLPGEFDSKGGDRAQVDEALIRQYGELYRSVDCVWYCTDDVEVMQMRPQDHEREYKDRGLEVSRELVPTANRVEKLCRYGSMFRDNVPIVFLLGKSDCIARDNAGSSYRFYEEKYTLDSVSWASVAEERRPALLGHQYYMQAFKLRQFLHGRNATLVNEFERNFPYHTYIATSNYGRPASAAAEAAEPPKPFQTEAPFLWFLAVYGYLAVLDESGEPHWTIQRDKKSGAYKVDQVTKDNLGMTGKAKTGYYRETQKSERRGVLKWLRK